MADYFDEVEAEIREAQRENPDAVLPWSWWQQRGERHGMSPNAIYTRAVKVGLYVPPSKREGAVRASAPRPFTSPSPPVPPSDRANADRNPDLPPASPSKGVSSPSQPGLGDAIQGVSNLVERVAGLEQQVTDLSRDLTASRMENRRLRRILREMDGFAEKIRQTYLTVLNED